MRAAGPGPLRLLLGSFAALIGCGTLLLKLPAATPPGMPIGWIDALFTATSATCVTGLIVRDTGSAFTPLGQLVILALIQLGGLGVMTFSLLIFSRWRGRLSLAHRSIMEQTLAGAGAWEDFLPLLRLVIRFTLGVEALGALLLFARWRRPLGTADAAWSAVFHSISAFCNAGFGLWSDSLVRWRADAWTSLTVAALILLGGLGFLILYDLKQSLERKARVSLHTRIALVVSAALVAVGTAVIWALEARFALRGLPLGDQLLASLFQSVTARTAGFNTIEISALAPATLFLLILLMFIGGSPGSCAGGIKTTTFGVLTLAAWTRLRHRANVNAFGRTISRTTVQNTVAIAMGGAFVVVASLFLLLLLEGPASEAQIFPGAFLGYLFETVSALGTVGLSTGVTPHLEPASRLLVTLMMFVGRLGPLTVAAAVAGRTPLDDWRHPEEEVMVG